MIRKNNNKKIVSVIGDGSWATALVKLITEDNNKVKWWIRNKERARYIRAFGHNPYYLSSVHFVKRRLRPSVRLEKVLDLFRNMLSCVCQLHL